MLLFLFSSAWLIIQVEKNYEITHYFDSLWWTMVTITTVGYGDFVPQTFLGKLFGILIMFIGLFLISFITGQLATFMINRESLKKKGLISLKNLKNHYIICGWRNDLFQIIELISEAQNNKTIVLINDQNPEIMEALLTGFDDLNISFIKGDYMNTITLEKGSISKAEKVIVLADETEKGTMREIDSKTVMTVINIKNLNPRCYVIAELLDDKFSHYLELSQCDEIVSTNHLNRKILSKTMINGGLSSIMDHLFSEHLDLVDIPDIYIGYTYQEIKEIYQKPGNIIIGVLENTGNLYQRKKDAIKEAQKTADISKLVGNLKTAKELKSNLPVINPDSAYHVKNNSKLITIKRI